MGLFGKRSEKPNSDVISSSAAATAINSGDFEKCGALLRDLETALDVDDGKRRNAAAHALAVAGGYPPQTGNELVLYRVKIISENGIEAARDINIRPWRWLAEVAATACERDNQGKLLAARLGLVAWMWREVWKDDYAEIAKAAASGNQFAEEVALIPPPDDYFAAVVGAGVKALGTLDDEIQVVRECAGEGQESLSVVAVHRVLCTALVDLHQKGVDFDAFVRAIAYSMLSDGH